MKIYVGNLAYETDEEALRAAFAAFGEVASVNIALFRDSNRSRGFGFVEMLNEDEAEAAVSGMNGSELDGRVLRVNEAFDRPRQNRGPYKGGYRGSKKRHNGYRGRHGNDNQDGFGKGKWRSGRW